MDFVKVCEHRYILEQHVKKRRKKEEEKPRKRKIWLRSKV
jgi:hypothetical protein